MPRDTSTSSTEQGIAAKSAEIPANPMIPCHGCGTEERFLTMKNSDDWTLTYPEENQWAAYCPECKVQPGTDHTGGEADE